MAGNLEAIPQDWSRETRLYHKQYSNWQRRLFPPWRCQLLEVQRWHLYEAIRNLPRGARKDETHDETGAVTRNSPSPVRNGVHALVIGDPRIRRNHSGKLVR